MAARSATDLRAAVVLCLGDIVYPAGMRDPGTPAFPDDSLHLEAQIDMVDGPRAQEHDAAAYFVAGNHDWGEARGPEGKQRIQNMGDFLDRNTRTWRTRPACGSAPRKSAI